MKVLVIPDVHLQSWMFYAADAIMEKYNYDRVVVLGDIVDTHGDSGRDLNLYYTGLEAALEFAKKYSSKLTWLLGNHDISYASWKCTCSDHNFEAGPMVVEYFQKICKALGKDTQIAARIDNVIFSHAGFAEVRARSYINCEVTLVDEWDAIVEGVNRRKRESLWERNSPIWYRPSGHILPLQEYGVLQVVGHTPTKCPCVFHNMLLTDTFWPGGANLFPVIDSVTQEIMWLDKEGEIKGYGGCPELS